MAWTREQIETTMRERVRGISDEEIRSADRHAIVGVVFTPPLSAEEAPDSPSDEQAAPI